VVVRVSAGCSLQYYDTDGWVAGRTFGPQKPNPKRISSGTGGEGGPEEELADTGSPGKMAIKCTQQQHQQQQ